MYLEADKRYKLILGSVLAVTLILGVMIFVVPPCPFPDPSWGFQVMRATEQGHAFNTLPSPDPTNIAVDRTVFLSWWSPGQYLLPYFLKAVLRLNTGRATALTIILCSILGLLGYFKLFKRLGFTPNIAAVSVAFIACQNYFILPYIFYTGGETLIFAFAGWFLYGCFGIEKISWKALVFVFFAGLIGFFSKSSALWMYAAGLACIWIKTSVDSKKILIWIKNGALLALPFIAALGIIYFCYLSKGENPSGSEGGLLIRSETFTFPLASPFVAGLSLDELFNGFIFHGDAAIFNYGWATVMLIGLAAASFIFLICVYRFVPDKNYALAITVLYVVGSLFFIDLYLKQASVSYEGRHYRIIGILAIPGMVYFASKAKATQVAFGVMWIAFICWEIKTFTLDYKFNMHSARGASGFSWQGYEPATLNELIKLDNEQSNAIFVITNPDIAIEIKHNRIITLNIEDMDKDDFAELKFAGYGGPVYILMPVGYIKNGNAAGITKAFTSYPHFETRQLSKTFYLYTGVN
jgi:hypothetical protein